MLLRGLKALLISMAVSPLTFCFRVCLKDSAPWLRDLEGDGRGEESEWVCVLGFELEAAATVLR